VAGRTYLFAISLGVHVALGAALATIPVRARREVIAISMAETKKPKPVVHPDPPPPPEPVKAAARPVQAKAAPAPPKATDVAPANDASPSLADALPDFGLALSNGAGGGVAVPAGGRANAPVPAANATKTLSRGARGPADDCDDPPAKPKPRSRPTPAYTEQARAAGVSGKVRVEITVNEQGRVVSVRVLQGLGYGLDEAAVAAARSMTFEPAVRCGKAASATFRVGFNFSPGTP
jgi:periplasmic protein TonB